ncbi:MAG TPA: hypothetical protein VH721_00635 [Gaiellaceae bacterium]
MSRAAATRIVALTVATCLLGAAASPGAASRAKAPVPAVLTETESSAEDLIDDALAGDRGSVISGAASLAAAASGPAATTLTKAGVPAATIIELEQRASRVARLSRKGPLVEVLLAANAVSQLMPALYGHFEASVPTAILTLDYLDREAQFRSLAGQPQLVATAVADLGRTWASVRPKVITAGGKPEAAAYDRHVAAMERLARGAGKQLQAEAVRGLELVDRLEGVFG